MPKSVKLVKFGKSIKSISRHKNIFFEQNKELQTDAKKKAKLYCKQPLRKSCKNCGVKLNKVDFHKLYVPYSICSRCGHLNGLHEDTDEFLASFNESLANYESIYISKEKKKYEQRMRDIYLPKIKFLLEVMKNNKVNLKDLDCLEIGAGSGFLLKAFDHLGIKKIRGLDPSFSQVKYANKMIGEEKVFCKKHEDIEKILKETKSNVVCMINVLEHFKKPNKILKILKNNKNIKYLFFSVPLFSLCVLFEMANPQIWHRHLSGPHTHLYTYQSIKFFCRKFKFSIIGEWWFGSDFFDFYRQIIINAENSSNYNSKTLREELFEMTDEFQNVLDKNKKSSDVHMVLKV